MSADVRSAATVVLLRDADDGLETFLLRRTSTMAFAPRMHVFPGGRVDPRDFGEAIRLVDADVEELARRGSTDTAEILALYACAVRETEEEAGLVVAERDEHGQLVIDPRLLPIIDHWVTPDVESHRYDVRFFAAAVPDGRAQLTTTEADEAVWIAPAAAISEFEAGRLPLLPPTESVLRYLSGFTRAHDVLAEGGRRPIVPLLPRRIEGADGSRRWVLVHDRTGEVLVDGIVGPHTRETDGRPMDDA